MDDIIGYGIVAMPILPEEKPRWANRKELRIPEPYGTQLFKSLVDAEAMCRVLNKRFPIHYPFDFRTIDIKVLPTNIKIFSQKEVNKKSLDDF